MAKIFYIMGKSASGKDTVFRRLLESPELHLKTIVPYTTRPIRSGEKEGVEYHFTDLEGLQELDRQGKVVEQRCYHTVHGDWYYFTVDDGSVQGSDRDFLCIGTPESYGKMLEYYGTDVMVPLYLSLEDGERLARALARERSQAEPKYKELCRRFLADEEDFAEEKLAQYHIGKRFENIDLEQCLQELKQEIIRAR